MAFNHVLGNKDLQVYGYMGQSVPNLTVQDSGLHYWQ